MNLKKCSMVLIASLLLSTALCGYITIAYAGNSSDGSATIPSTDPSITNLELWNEAEDTDKNNTALVVNTEYHANFTITDGNTLADLKNITILIYDDTGSTWDDSDAEIDHYTMTWVESTDVWDTSSYVDDADCKDPGTGYGETSFEFTLSFDLSKVATYRATPTWKMNITVWDDSENSDTDTTIMFGIAFYQEVNVVDTTHSWTNINPGTNNQTLSTPADHKIDITVIANAAYDVQAQSNASNLVSGSDTIAISNVRIYGADTLTSSASLTTSYADVGGLTSQSATTAEASPASHELWLWLTVPDGTPSGTYVYQLQTQVVQA